MYTAIAGLTWKCKQSSSQRREPHDKRLARRCCDGAHSFIVAHGVYVYLEYAVEKTRAGAPDEMGRLFCPSEIHTMGGLP
ncbi:hypothetical protein KSX_89150 [Ktedonospora formicarum]|uniref:Uncharacterized protein n=1 Tax=Ktedonospora formicarum TaxID=2778364 RepID=A0A8J3IDI1_9CHLR|nr:hypothetical protein KSX_89150 [Ktedonospora formicarum]